MLIGELAAKSATTIKAVRYYELLGLVVPKRQCNGYRHYSDDDLRKVQEIRELAQHGINPAKAKPFLECLDAGHRHSDECPASLAAYRDSITELDHAIASLTSRRQLLAERLQQGAARTFIKESNMTDYATTLPDNLPVPEDDGAAAHLPGLTLPSLVHEATDGQQMDLSNLGPGRSIIYLYPLTGLPGTDLPEGWDSIPGARGCSTEACDFRDHFAQLQAAGVERVHGFSSQDPDYQREVTTRLRLPFTMLSDTGFELARALNLPTFAAPGHPRLYSRLTLVVRAGVIEHVFYPIFPPNTHAQQVLAWLEAHPVA
ncbi:peroxidoxin containing protein [Arthrobacter sp. PAMC 25486]|uniref:MerR family transcriptional regulator n=1 Tax=Arthrobacter sp. PAMC 25486 TaxID=1494608 RepID=UPI000535B262|nr:MerR family transcriptional regulator [Arthrobacter sp. PAMC 25486]AIY00120.1 peroxidoxin containing protein [Arthrobacter sp. PAMC 25486]